MSKHILRWGWGHSSSGLPASTKDTLLMSILRTVYKLGLVSHTRNSTIIPALRRQMEEDMKFKVTISYSDNLQPAWQIN